MEFKIPVRNNKKLKALVNRINADQELFQIWKCANINAVDRSGISDHGEVHIRIVANAALRIIRLLVKGGIVLTVIYNDPVADDKTDPPQTINFYRRHNKYCLYD